MSVAFNNTSSSPLLTDVDFNIMWENLAADRATIPTAAQAVYQTEKFLVETIHANYRFKNQSNLPQTVTFYDIAPRRDHELTGLTPLGCWSGGLSRANVALAGSKTVTPTTLNATPFQSELFVFNWKVLRVNKFVLDPGAEHIHYVNLKINKVFSFEYHQYYKAFAHKSYFPMVVVSGGMVQDTSSPFNVSTGGGEVDFICTVKYKFRQLSRARKVITNYHTLPASMTVQGTVLEDTDAVAVVDTVA